MIKDKETNLESSNLDSPKISADVLPGVYFNEASIMSSVNDFVLDMIRNMPNDFSQVMSRMVCTPLTAKLFCLHLMECIQNYEAEFGEIAINKDIADDNTSMPPVAGEA